MFNGHLLKTARYAVYCHEVAVKYGFVWTHQPGIPCPPLCQVLQVSRGDFYAWQRRETSIPTQVEKALIWLVGIVALRRRRDVRTMQIDPYESPTIPHRLNQQCAISAKNRVWAVI